MAALTKREERLNELANRLAQLTITDERAVYKTVRDVIGDGADVKPSYLQVYKTLGNNLAQYQFDLAQARNEEVALPVSKLRDTEAFVMTRLRISLLRVTTGTTGAPAGFERVQTFVNTNVFAAAAGFTPEHLNAVFHGELSWMVNNKDVMWYGLATDRCEWIPQTQDIGSTAETMIDQNAGFITPPSFSIFNGGKTNKIILDLPQIATPQWASVTAGVFHVVAFRGEGLRISSDGLNNE